MILDNRFHQHIYTLVSALKNVLYLLIVCFMKLALFLKLQNNLAKGFHHVVIHQQMDCPLMMKVWLEALPVLNVIVTYLYYLI